MKEKSTLQKGELRRLREIAAKRFTNFGICRKTNEKLVEKGLIVERGRETSSTGRVRWFGNAHVTDAGLMALKEA